VLGLSIPYIRYLLNNPRPQVHERNLERHLTISPAGRFKSPTMHTSSLLPLLATASFAAAQCNQVQIFTAVGHGETYPGVQRSITTAVCRGISSCGVENIQYESVKKDNSYNGCKAIVDGIAYGKRVIAEYAAKCPEAKIVVTGWSMVSLIQPRP